MSKPSKGQESKPPKKPKIKPSVSGGSSITSGKFSKNKMSESEVSSDMKARITGKESSLHPLEELLGTTVANSSGLTVNPKTFAEEGAVIGLYFAAHWCPPCRLLTPMLALMYDELKKNEKKFEVIFISFDYSEDSFTSYFSKMPWYAVDYADSDRREEIADLFGIKGIPVLIFLEADSCKIITNKGREILTVDPMGTLFPWKFEEQETAAAEGNSSTTEGVNVPANPEETVDTPNPDTLLTEPETKLAEDATSAVGDTNKD